MGHKQQKYFASKKSLISICEDTPQLGISMSNIGHQHAWTLLNVFQMCKKIMSASFIIHVIRHLRDITMDNLGCPHANTILFATDNYDIEKIIQISFYQCLSTNVWHSA